MSELFYESPLAGAAAEAAVAKHAAAATSVRCPGRCAYADRSEIGSPLAGLAVRKNVRA